MVERRHLDLRWWPLKCSLMSEFNKTKSLKRLQRSVKAVSQSDLWTVFVKPSATLVVSIEYQTMKSSL
jgi:hypothetical protein